MSRPRNDRSSDARTRATKAGQAARRSATPNHAPPAHSLDWFTWFAHKVARLSGRPPTFAIATGIIVLWAMSGPLFHYSDTWQLVINTGTTIVTFLMVFLIQNTQNRDTMALQIKLAELIISQHGAHNQMANAEDMSEADLEALHVAYRKRAEETQASLERRRKRTAG